MAKIAKKASKKKSSNKKDGIKNIDVSSNVISKKVFAESFGTASILVDLAVHASYFNWMSSRSFFTPT